MNPRTIKTDIGSLDLIPASVDQVRGIARYWPMEIVGSSNEPDSFGLIFQHGDEEVHGVKLQPADIPEADAKVAHHVNRALIASALPFYLEKQHKGVMVPCAYYKEKAKRMVETGIVFFVGPDAASKSSSREKADTLFDDQLGAGATPMIFDMGGAIARASKQCGLPQMVIIGMDIRPRLAVGSLALHFIIEGPHVFVVKDQLQEEEPVWRFVVHAGFSRLPYAPMTPAGFQGPPPANISRI